MAIDHEYSWVTGGLTLISKLSFGYSEDREGILDNFQDSPPEVPIHDDFREWKILVDSFYCIRFYGNTLFTVQLNQKLSKIDEIGSTVLFRAKMHGFRKLAKFTNNR